MLKNFTKREKMQVTLLNHTPLNICSHAIRTCWQSFEKGDNGGEKDVELIDRVGNKFKHASTLEHLYYNFYIQGVSRALLQELARHRLASLSVKSTRCTLKDLKIDETGTIIGAFSNGKSFGLAQVALATFTNNEGLQSEGGNVFSQTANSGEAVIGAAGTGDKGTIAASKLEASNVDLSRALTDLIVIQRGFQANSKTITTSDEMLNTLLQLKQ